MNGEAKSYGAEFSKEEIDAEERRPKRKVAVLIGYAGTGYKGMQISPAEKTIEGDLFQAFVKAGAISKANADDPKKASLVRCARTDKGVHAAGNMISLKLIVEDDDIVEKINSHLTPQIRVWGIERTIGSFSCYQACDSRWYEYLIPSYAFVPPHPSSWLAKKIESYADEAGDREAYNSRQAEVSSFWEDVDGQYVKAILDDIDEDIRFDVVKALQGEEEASAKTSKPEAEDNRPVKVRATQKDGDDDVAKQEKTEEAAIVIADSASAPAEEATEEKVEETSTSTNRAGKLSPEEIDRIVRLRAATKRLRAAYTTAKRRYRIPQERIQRIQDALTKFVGTSNYHNYTVAKTFRDPSAKRHIKSFVVNTKPILIGDGPEEEKSEWLSLKVHGQSFMMHQIRKMIGMVTLLVRSGSDLNTLTASMQSEKFSIPKVPGLGLLLERPVFDSYNVHQAPKHGRDPLRFDKYEATMDEFKQREIYERIFREELERNEFGRFFNHIDNFKEPYFLYVTSKGLEATKEDGNKAGNVDRMIDGESSDEGGFGEDQ